MPKKISITEVIKKSTGELIKDVAELGIDEIIDRIEKDATIFKNLPVIKWAFLVHEVTNKVHLSFFLKKYALFIGPIQKEISDDFWDDEKIEELMRSKKKFTKLIEETVVALDRYQAVNKAKILGILFVKTFKEKIFTIDEYNTLIFSIELMHPHLGIECLKQFYFYRLRMEKATNKKEEEKIWLEGSKLDFSPLTTTCFLRLPSGGAYVGDMGGAYLNDFGQKFYVEVVSKI